LEKSKNILFIYFYIQRWEYMHEPKEGTEEAKLINVLKNPVDWLNIENKGK